MIYGPGTHPGRVLRLPLEGYEMRCERATVMVNAGDGPGESLNFPVTKMIWAGARGLRQTPVAEIPGDVATKLSLRGRFGLYTDLVNALREPGFCGFSVPEKGAAELAAQELQLSLPRPYSSVLQSAYNHRVWKEAGGASTNAVSIDMLPGMRLRVENSVPIAPAGINSRNEHPSSFAAPSFIYFHALSGRELCDPKSMVVNSSSTHVCKGAEPEWEARTYLSAAGGLARLGLRQHEDHLISDKDVDRAYVTSGLVDMLERSETEDGAWRYWRLWLPVHRDTKLTTLLSQPPSGSAEDAASAPLLIAGASLAALNALDYSVKRPCMPSNAATSARCHSLRYRVVPVPEFVVHVNGQRQWVPVGTTLADVLADRLQDGFAPRPYFFSSDKKQEDLPNAASFPAASARNVLDGVAVRRMRGGQRHSVLPTKLIADEEVRRFLRLQLVPGDEVIWQ